MALMAAPVSGFGYAEQGGVSRLVQLLETQRSGWTYDASTTEGDVITSEEPTTPGGDEVAFPVPLASYDFETDEIGNTVQLKADNDGTAPTSVPLNATGELGLNFVSSDKQNSGYARMDNPFKNHSEILNDGATISIWVYRADSQIGSLWGFGQDQSDYEEYPMIGFSAGSYLAYNSGGNNDYIDFNRSGTDAIPLKQMTMVTWTFTTGGYHLYINGEEVDVGYRVKYATLSERLTNMLTMMSNETFSAFYIGKGQFEGTFAGKADKLEMYALSLSAEQVKALYEREREHEEDVSNLVQNTEFNDGETTPWDTDGAGFNATLLKRGMVDVVVQSGYTGAKTFDFSQTLTDLPVGIYRLSVQAGSTPGNSAELYLSGSYAESRVTLSGANLDAYSLVDVWASDKEDNRVYTGNVMVLDGTVKLGINRYSDGNGELFFDNFRLEKMGDGYLETMDMYTELEGKSNALVSLLPDELGTQISAVTAVKPETLAEYGRRYMELLPLYTLGECYVNECPLGTLLDTCAAYAANSVATRSVKVALSEAIAAAESTTLSDTATLRRAYGALEQARRTFVLSAEPTGEQTFDMTFLVENANVKDYADRQPVPGWSGENPGNLKGWALQARVPGGSQYCGDTGLDRFLECYADATLRPCWAIYQDVELPSGTYTLTAAAFAGPVNSWIDAGTGKVSLCVGDESKVALDEVSEKGAANLKYYKLDFVQATDGTVRIGLKVEDGNLANWCAVNDVKIIKKATDAAIAILTLDETKAYSVASGVYDVKMNRTLVADVWNTFCVPFDMTPDQLSANGITKVVQLTGVEGTVDDGINLMSTEVTDGVKARMPYLVKVNGEKTQIAVGEVFVTDDAPIVWGIGEAAGYAATMTGNYADSNVPLNAYFINGNSFYLADKIGIDLHGFRAYITLTDETGTAGVNIRSLSIDGVSGDDALSVSSVTGEETDKPVDVYTLDGVRVKSGVKKGKVLDGLQRGIYIVDGQKVVK